jgi:hypothetical protein
MHLGQGDCSVSSSWRLSSDRELRTQAAEICCKGVVTRVCDHIQYAALISLPRLRIGASTYICFAFGEEGLTAVVVVAVVRVEY